MTRRSPDQVLAAVRRAVGAGVPVLVKINTSDGCAGRVSVHGVGALLGEATHKRSRSVFVCSFALPSGLSCDHVIAALNRSCAFAARRFEGGITPADAIAAAVAFARGGADAVVPSAGFVSRSGFYMLRGRTPLLALARALPGVAKKIAVLVFGPCVGQGDVI